MVNCLRLSVPVPAICFVDISDCRHARLVVILLRPPLFQLVKALSVLIGMFVPGQYFIAVLPRIQVVQVCGSVVEGQFQLLGQRATNGSS